MSEPKTKETKASVDKFLKAVKDEKKREDSYKLIDVMKKITKAEPKMWGPGIVGFGNFHYKYSSGREGDWMLAGFAPRKQAISLYLMRGMPSGLLKQLGKFKTGGGCLYIKKLEDINIPVLEKLIKESISYIKETYI